MALRLSSKPVIIAATASAAILGLSGYVWKEEHRPHELEVYVFNLPSGRSMFIRTPDDYRVLVDGGSNGDVIRELTAIIPFYSRRIDALIVTYPDAKDVAGLVDVLDRYKVGHIYLPSVTASSIGLIATSDPAYTAFLDRAQLAWADMNELDASDTVLLGASVHANILFPVLSGRFSYSRASPPEILFTLSYKNTSVVFLGDASHKVQEFLAAAFPPPGSADVLIVSHSALPQNMSARLMDELRPSYLVYAKSPQKAAAAKNTQKKLAKTPPDPLAGIPTDNRLNVREKNTVHLVSDGIRFIVKRPLR